jgi:hypothetical protein
MKPFNFEQFKHGKAAIDISGCKYNFINMQESLDYPIVCSVINGHGESFISSHKLKYFEEQAKMLPTKRTVWIAILKYIKGTDITPSSNLFSSKEEALDYKANYWKVIDAIPYEIEE